MKYTWIDSYCLSKSGVVKDYKEEWQAFRYMIDGKMFAMVGEYKDGRAIISLKGDPFINISLRETFSDIIEGYYLNKEHWNSIFLDGSVPIDVLKKMIDDSYMLIMIKLPKKIQNEILGSKNKQ